MDPLSEHNREVLNNQTYASLSQHIFPNATVGITCHYLHFTDNEMRLKRSSDWINMVIRLLKQRYFYFTNTDFF